MIAPNSVFISIVVAGEAGLVVASNARQAGRFLICALTALFIASSARAEAVSTLAVPDVAAITEHVLKTMARDRVPGAAVTVIWRGELLLLKGFGEDGRGRAVTPRTGFRLGSISKAFTAQAVMAAVEAERLSLDAPVQTVLTDFMLSDRDVSARITLRHLLAHSSGLPRTAARAKSDASLAAHVAALAAVTPVATPGERHIYSSPNYLVAARMLEVAEGRPFAEVITDRVLSPLGLQDTFVTEADDRAGNLSRGHQYWFGFPRAVDLLEEPGRLATAGLISSAADMARFLRFQLGDGAWEGQRLLTSQTMATMHRGTAQGDGFRYAMGWRETQIGEWRALEHGGVLPDFRGKMILLPHIEAAVVVLTNASSMMPVPAAPTSHRLADEIAAHLIGEPLRGPALPFGMVVLLLWAGFGLLLLRLITAASRRFATKGASPRKLLRIAADFAVVVFLAAGIPVLIGLSWREMWIATPDLVLWTAAMVAVMFIAAFADIRRIQRADRVP